MIRLRQIMKCVQRSSSLRAVRTSRPLTLRRSPYLLVSVLLLACGWGGAYGALDLRIDTTAETFSLYGTDGFTPGASNTISWGAAAGGATNASVPAQSFGTYLVNADDASRNDVLRFAGDLGGGLLVELFANTSGYAVVSGSEVTYSYAGLDAGLKSQLEGFIGGALPQIFGSGAGAMTVSAAAVPEPGGAMLALMCVIGLSMSRMRRPIILRGS
jgi:hypothetical protein